ncbi:Glutaredoxin-2, mitochondrial [Dictyocoela muelleri]|nr:Glutaredoxin-2, mitochondrial [Dictyocoela muelleri]
MKINFKQILNICFSNFRISYKHFKRYKNEKKIEIMEFPLEMRQYLAKHPNLIIGKEDCKYCTKAKDLLDDHFIEYKYIENDYLKIREFMKQKTFPCIFYKGQFIGGYKELKEIIKNEEEKWRYDKSYFENDFKKLGF